MTAIAQTADWDGGNGGGGDALWSVAGNWAGGFVPSSTSFDVLIDNGDAINSVATLDSTRTIGSLTIDSGDTLSSNNAATLNHDGATLTNNGVFLINGLTSNTSLNFSTGAHSITGSGEIVFGDDTQSRISGTANPVITHGADHTIRGGGSLLANTASMINDGTILGDGSTLLTIDPVSTGFTNNGVLRATSAEGIRLNNSTYTNNSTIEALAGSKVDVNGVTVVGGTFSSTGSGAINVTASSTFNAVTIAAGSTVNENNAVSVTVLNGLTNNGTWNNLGATSNANLQFSGDQTLGGSGEIIFNNDTQSRITGLSAPVITHDAGHTIRGGGSLLVNTAGMINNGTILGDGTLALTIDPSSEDFVNNGVLRATSAAGLRLNSGKFTNNTTIEALADSNVDLSTATIVGGTFSSTGTGAINVLASSTFDGVTIAAGSTVNENNAASVTVLNGLTNNGTWNNLGATTNTSLQFSGDQTIGGTGTIVLHNDTQSRITGLVSPIITHGAGHTIRGGGSLLVNSAGMINDGTILGDGTLRLTIDPDGGGFVNNNVLRATSVAGIRLLNGTFTNTTTIEALADSQVDLSASTVIGGTFSSTGTGAINITVSSTLDGVTIAAGSTVNESNAATVTVLNGLTNNGTWNNLGTTSGTSLQFDGNQTLGGTGEVLLNNDNESRITGVNTAVITHGANHTIRGGGALLNNSASMINNGTILGDGSIALKIDPNGDGFVNNNILRATGAGGVRLQNGTFTNNSTIDALADSKVDLVSVTIVGGTLAGTGAINIISSSTFDGVTIATGSTVNENNAASVTVENGLTNNGTWNNLGTASGTNLQFNGSQTLDGTGTVVLNNDSQSRITGIGNPVITQGADHTIRGGGSLLNNSASLINNGSIINDGGSTLTINPDSNGLTNNGLIQAEGLSTITIQAGGTFTNSPGALIAGDGTINVSAISFTNDGGVSPGQSAGILNLTGNYSESSTATLFIEIGGTTVGTEYDQFAISGDAALAGTLDVSLLGFAPSAADTFTILTTASGDVTGTFATESLHQFVNGLFFDVVYSINDVQLVVGGIEGDYNYDGTVDAADYTVWRDGLGTTFVQADYDVWVANFGLSAPAIAISNSVPEPTSAFMLLSLGSLLSIRRRHRG